MEKADPSMCNVELFKSLLGNPSYFNELPNELIAYSVSCFSDFSVVVCNLLKKWIDETDMCEGAVKKIDSSLVYWRPDCELKKPTSHDCFQKYLSDHWKNDLPKMILIRDAHNLFSFPGSCCNEVKSSNIFDILKDELQSEANLMRQIDVISPDLVKCKLHANCLLLIAHKENCPEPYLCDGENQMCELECEVTLKKRKKSCDSSKLIGTMAFEVQGTSKGLRTVSTQIGDKNEVIATLYNGRNEKSPCEAYGQCEYLSLQENLCAQADYEMRNCYRQRNKKIQLKMRLRSKLDKKQLSQLEHYFDQDAAVKLYERAISAWKMDFCKENYQNLGNMKGLKPCKALLYGKNFEQFKKLMSSVVVSTSDAVFGRVVVPSTREQKVLNPTKNVNLDLLLPFMNENKETTTSGAKKSKKKKKKKEKNTNLSEEQSSTSKPETVPNIEPNENKTETTSTSTDAEGNTTKDYLSSGISPQDSSKDSEVVKEKSDEVPVSSCPKKDPMKEMLCLTKVKLQEIVKTIPEKDSLDLSKKDSESFCDQEVKELNSERPLTVKEEETVGKFFELIGIDPNQEKVDNQNDAVSSKVNDKKPLRVCANCNVKEVEYKSFKRCSRCKVENFPVHHYYCCRSCQIEDWEKCHREEHSKRNVSG